MNYIIIFYHFHDCLYHHNNKTFIVFIFFTSQSSDRLASPAAPGAAPSCPSPWKRCWSSTPCSSLASRYSTVQCSAVQCSTVQRSTELLLALIRFESIFSLGPIYTQTYELTEFIFATQTFKPFKPTFIYSTSQVLYVKAVVFKRLKGYDIFISTNKQSGYELFFPTIIF